MMPRSCCFLLFFSSAFGSLTSASSKRSTGVAVFSDVKKKNYEPGFYTRPQHNQQHLKLLPNVRGGGQIDVDEGVLTAYDWCVNLGAPAALVAGAVVGTLYENIRGGALMGCPGDSKYDRFAKKLTYMLLLSSFALQMVSIFATTVTGTMLLTDDMTQLLKTTTATTPLGFLKQHYEFEYLTSRVSFLQGLLHWLAAVAVEHTVGREGDGPAARNIHRFIASSLATLIALMLSFYNAHMTFYGNYYQMLRRWVDVTRVRTWGKLRRGCPLASLCVPGLLISAYFGIVALLPADREEPKADVVEAEEKPDD